MNKLKVENSVILLSILLILISMWMLNHPYKGLVHDARLYAVQAMSHIEPDIFKKDLFLRYDSQENYTIFSDLYVYVIKLTNLSAANIILFIIGHVLWFVSAYLLASKLNRGPLKFFALALAIAMPSYYGANFVFSFGEPFLTPRIFAEAFVLFSIFFALKNRFILCAFSLVMGFLMHPIMALTGIIFFSFYFLLKYPKPLLIIGSALAVSIILLALFKVAPCDRILQLMDPYWAGIVQERSPFLFLFNWTLRDFLPIITSFLVIMLYAVTNKGMKQAIALSLFTATGIFLLLSMVLGDFFWNVLVLQLQIWRISWLLLFFAYLALPSIYIKIKERTDYGTSFLTVYCAAWLSSNYSLLSPVYIFLAVISFLLILGNYSSEEQSVSRYAGFLKNRFSKDFGKKVNIILVLLSIVLLSGDVAIYFYEFNKLKEGISLISLFPPLHSIHALALLIIVGAPLLYYQLMKRDKRVIVLSVVFFLLAATLWDRRLEYEKLLGGNHGIEQVSLVKNIPIKSEILWFELPALSWFVANRTNYISRLQGAGVVFSRDTAILYDQRTKNIGVFRELLDRPFELYWKHRPSRTKKIYEKILTTCCRSAQDLDFIVASYKVPEYQPLKILSLKNVRINYTNLINLNYKDFDWYLYNCKTINTLY